MSTIAFLTSLSINLPGTDVRLIGLYCRFGNVRETLFSLIFANTRPREFKVLANIENTGF